MKMDRRYTYREVYARKVSRDNKSSSSENELLRESKLYKSDIKDSYSRTRDAVNILSLIGESGYLSRKYYSLAENILKEHHENPNIRNMFIENILPQSLVDDAKGLSSIEDLDQKQVQDRIATNMAIDRMLDNNDALNKNGKLDDFIKNTSNVHLCIDKCCETVNKFKVPIHGKFTIALEEAYFQLDKNGRKYDDKEVIDEVWDFFSTYNITEKDRKNIIFGLNHNIFKEDTIPDTEFTNTNDPISIFQNSPEKDEHLIDQTLNDVLNSYPYQLANLVERFFIIVEYQILAAHNITLATYMINIIPTIADKLGSSAFISNPGYKERILQIKDKITLEISRLTVELKNLVDSTNTEVQNLLAAYIDRLAELDNDLSDLADTLYPKQNMEAMQDFANENTMSLERFDYSQKKNFVSIIEQADRYLSIYLNEFEKVNQKNYNEADIYDMIDCNHKIDYLFSEYYISNPDQARLNNICIGLNGTIGPNHKCYYTVNEDTVEFHLKENVALNITEAQSEKVANHIIQEDANKIDLIINVSERAIGSFTSQDAIDAFKEENTHEFFKPFVELCEYANISKSDIDPIYEATFRGKKCNDKYFNESCDAMMKYQIKNAPYDIQMEAAELISMIVEAKDAKALSNKIKNGVNKVTHPAKKEGGNKNVAGNSDTHPVKNALVNLNLTLRGFGEKIKDLSSKEQNLAKRNDAQFRHFAKTAQDAIIGDRKEAIIKGQLIPSFSKCIKYAITGGIITAINPIAGIISIFGAIAVSKHIDKKIKLDMLDEIEVELEMIDKEINNADNRGQLKKERALLKTKKQLQRTYQRIKINAKLGKNLIPASYGTPNLDN